MIPAPQLPAPPHRQGSLPSVLGLQPPPPQRASHVLSFGAGLSQVPFYFYCPALSPAWWPCLGRSTAGSGLCCFFRSPKVMPQRRYQVNSRPLQEMCQLKTACGPGPRRRHGTSPPLPTLLPSAPLSFHLALSREDSNNDLIPYFHMCPARLRASSQTICFQNSLLVPRGPEILFLACPRRAPEILPTKNTKKEQRQARGTFSRAASTWGVGRARQVCPWGKSQK